MVRQRARRGKAVASPVSGGCRFCGTRAVGRSFGGVGWHGWFAGASGLLVADRVQETGMGDLSRVDSGPTLESRRDASLVRLLFKLLDGDGRGKLD